MKNALLISVGVVLLGCHKNYLAGQKMGQNGNQAALGYIQETLVQIQPLKPAKTDIEICPNLNYYRSLTDLRWTYENVRSRALSAAMAESGKKLAEIIYLAFQNGEEMASCSSPDWLMTESEVAGLGVDMVQLWGLSGKKPDEKVLRAGYLAAVKKELAVLQNRLTPQGGMLDLSQMERIISSSRDRGYNFTAAELGLHQDVAGLISFFQ